MASGPPRPPGVKQPRPRRPPSSTMPRLLLLALALLLWAMEPCGAPPINPGQGEELKLPIVKDTVKVNLGPSDSKDYRGSALCHVGDLDGNGVADMALGAYGDDTTATDAGAVVLLYLRRQADSPVISWRKITSGVGGFNIRLQAMDYFGASVAGVGDVDGDGTPDMVVGALGDDEAALNAGAIYLLYLQQDAATPVASAVKITGGKGGFDATMTQNSYFGSSVAFLGDVDGNGVGDIAVGAYGEDKLAGVVYILFLQNSATTPVLGWYKIRAKTPGFPFPLLPNDAFGTSVAGLGDVDGDGVPDLAVGAYMDRDYQSGAGAVYVLLLQRLGAPVRGFVGGPSAGGGGGAGASPVKAAVKIAPGQRGFGDTSLQPNAFFGASVAGFRDLDSDGVPELMVGTIGDGRANPNAGAIHLLYLGINATGDLLPTVKDWRKITTGLEGFKSPLAANTNFGAAIAEVPDLSGDNETEIAVGCYVASNASVYILYKNSLTGFAENPPQIYAVHPPILDTAGGEPVAMALAIDVTEVDLSKPYTTEAYIGTSPCLDPQLRPYDEAAAAAAAANAPAAAVVGARGAIVPAAATDKAAAAAAAAMPFPAVLASETQKPFLLTCTSTAGAGSHLLAQATISQGGADIPLLMANAASYAAPVVAAINATGSAARGGFDVRVTGRHFGARDYQPMVLVQDTPCALTVWVSDAEVVCQGAPAGLGTAQVKVSVAGQTSAAVPSAEITYDAPVLAGWNISSPMTVSLPVFGGYSTDLVFSPYTGGKEELSLWGQNFGPAGTFPRVLLGTLECVDAVVVSDGQITCTTPPGAGANLTVALSLGGVHAKLPGGFSYAPPLLVTIVPETANTDGGDLVIMGRNFGSDSGALEVRIGDEVCREVKMVYEHQLITCKYPAGGGKDLPMTVTLAGQSNAPPRAFSYADTYGQRTVEAVFLLVGEAFEGFSPQKQYAFEEVLFRALDNDPTLSVADDAVHICNVTSPFGDQSVIIGPGGATARAPTTASFPRAPSASRLVSSIEIEDAINLMDFEQEAAVAAADNMTPEEAEGTGEDAASNMAGGSSGRQHRGRRMDSVLVAVDIAASNAKAAASIQAWLRGREQQQLLLTYLNTKDTGIHAEELRVVATSVTTDLYCPPGQQQQDIGSEGGEKACFACPVGSFQPLRSKGPCVPCPVGADCLRQGIEYPVPMPGYWRQVLPAHNATKIDPYFEQYRIYSCNPADICLGGPDSACTDGHQPGSPLCAICEEGFYAGGSGVCQPCGPKRAIQITVFFALALALAAFFLLLFFFVRPGADIDEAAGTIKERLMEGPQGKAFNRDLNMSYFLSNTLSRHLASRLSDMTNLPDLWSKAKISITFFQIIASLNVAYTVPWPDEFTRLLRKLNVLNLNILNLPGMAYSCVQPIDYFAEFLVAFLFPIVLTGFFIILHAMGVRVIRRKVQANIHVVRSLEAQSQQMRNQLIKKMRLISVRMLKKRRPLRQQSSAASTAITTAAAAAAAAAPQQQPQPTTTTAALAPNAEAGSSSSGSTTVVDDAAAVAHAGAGLSATACPPIHEDRTVASFPQDAYFASVDGASGEGVARSASASPPPPPLLQPAMPGSLHSSRSNPVLGSQDSALYHYPSRSSSMSPSPKEAAVVIAGPSSPLPMPPPGASRFSPPPSRGSSPLPPAGQPTSPPRPARSPLSLPLVSTSSTTTAPAAASSAAPAVPREPSPAVRSAVIDIFSPRPPTAGTGAAATASSSLSLSTASTAAVAASSEESGGGGGSSAASSTASSQPAKVRKKATFSETVTAAVVGGGGDQLGDGGAATTTGALEKDESLGGTRTAGGSAAARLLRAGSAEGGDDDEEDESIVEIKHKLTLLEKQQDVEKFSIERYTSRLITFWFWIVLLIYPSVSRVVLEGVNCRTLDNGRKYLASDFTIDCQSPYYMNHLPLIVPAVVLYPVGIPLMFFLLLKFKRDAHPWDENLSFLYKAYRKEYWWFEIYELLRKLFLTGLIIFIAAGTATQLAIACIVCAVTMCLHLRLRPYVEPGDDLLQGCSLAEVLLITYCALLLKLDLTGADAVSVRVFDVLLIGTNAVVVLGIMPASFYIQSRQYMSKILTTMSFSLPAMMKRELLHRGAVAAALLLALWATLANSVYDPLTVTITTAALIMFAYTLLVGLYFLPPLNARLPLRYRIVPVLAPQASSMAEVEKQSSILAFLRSSSKLGGGDRDRLGMSTSSGFASMGGGAASYHRSSSGAGSHLAKLNARKLEAIRAAGLSNAQLERHHHRHQQQHQQQQPPPRSESMGLDGVEDPLARRPSYGAAQRSSIDSSLNDAGGGYDGSSSTSSSSASVPDRSWLGRLVLAPWTVVVRHRRLVDPIMAVLLVDLAVMCADEGQGTANYARLVMLAVAALLTMALCAIPHVKDGHPHRVSVLRVAQCVFALSTVNILLVAFQSTKALRAAAGSPRAYSLALFAQVAALVVAILCALHATAGIVRGLRATAPGAYSSMNNNSSNTANATADAGGDGGVTKPPAAETRKASASLARKGSVYGGSRKARIWKDLLLLLAIVLTIVGLVLSRPRAGGHHYGHGARIGVPVSMMVGLALLFSYKPLRALREAEEEFVGQLLLLRIMVRALWPRHGRGRRGRRGRGRGRSGSGGGGDASDHEEWFDEHDLSAATRPEALAAEVIRLRRKVAALEERLEEPAPAPDAAGSAPPGPQG